MDLEGKTPAEITACGSYGRLELPECNRGQRWLGGAAKVSIDTYVWQLKTADSVIAAEVGKYWK
ncbi:hypothetical protein JCM30471_09180 [Desulfuromonas carbonis]